MDKARTGLKRNVVAEDNGNAALRIERMQKDKAFYLLSRHNTG